MQFQIKLFTDYTNFLEEYLRLSHDAIKVSLDGSHETPEDSTILRLIHPDRVTQLLQKLRAVKKHLENMKAIDKNLQLFKKTMPFIIKQDTNQLGIDAMFNSLMSMMNEIAGRGMSGNYIHFSEVAQTISAFEEYIRKLQPLQKKYKHFDTSKYSEEDKKTVNTIYAEFHEGHRGDYPNYRHFHNLLNEYQFILKKNNDLVALMKGFESVFMQILNTTEKLAQQSPSPGLETTLRGFRNLMS